MARQKCTRALFIVCAIAALATAIAAFRLRDDETDTKTKKTHTIATVDRLTRRGNLSLPWPSKTADVKTSKNTLINIPTGADQIRKFVKISQEATDSDDDEDENLSVGRKNIKINDKKTTDAGKNNRNIKQKLSKFNVETDDENESEDETHIKINNNTKFQYFTQKSSEIQKKTLSKVKENDIEDQSDKDDGDVDNSDDFSDNDDDDNDGDNDKNDSDVDGNGSDDNDTDGGSDNDDDDKSDNYDDDNVDDDNIEDDESGDESNIGNISDDENMKINIKGRKSKDIVSDTESDNNEDDKDNKLEVNKGKQNTNFNKVPYSTLKSKLSTHNIKADKMNVRSASDVDNDNDSDKEDKTDSRERDENNNDEESDMDTDEEKVDDSDDDDYDDDHNNKLPLISTKSVIKIKEEDADHSKSQISHVKKTTEINEVQNKKHAKPDTKNLQNSVGSKFASISFDDDDDDSDDDDEIAESMKALLLKIQASKQSDNKHSQLSKVQIEKSKQTEVKKIPVNLTSLNEDNLLLSDTKKLLPLTTVKDIQTPKNRTELNVKEFLEYTNPVPRDSKNLEPKKEDQAKVIKENNVVEKVKTTEIKVENKPQEKRVEKTKETSPKIKEKVIESSDKVKPKILKPDVIKDSLDVVKKVKPEEKTKTKGSSEEVKKAKSEVKLNIKNKKIDAEKIPKSREAHVRKTVLESSFDDFYTFLPTFAPNYSRIHNPECRRQGQILMRQLHGAKLWALQMVDASAKIPSGLLSGNANQLGDFDECVGTRARVRLDSGAMVRVKGKYCLAYIDVSATKDELRLPVHLLRGRDFIRSNNDDPGSFIPRFTSIRWGICMPSACDAKDAEFAVRDSLRHYDATPSLSLKVRVHPEDCHQRHDAEPEKLLDDIPTLITVIGITFVILVTVTATVRDLWKNKTNNRPENEEQESEGKNEELKESAEESEANIVEETGEKEMEKLGEDSGSKSNNESSLWEFSILRSWRKLTAEIGEDDVGCVYGIRALCGIALYASHKVITLGLTPYVNRIELTELANSAFSVIFRSGFLYTDTYLFLSGLLAAYHMSGDLMATGDMKWFKKFIARYVRLTPAMVGVIAATILMQFVGDGPQWGVVKENANFCKENMFRNLLYIQNFYDFEEMCVPQTHHLALDMQLSLLSAPLVWLMMNRTTIAAIVFAGLHSFSAWSRYSASMEHNLSMVVYHGATSGQLLRTANFSYILPHHRATPYLAGVTLGVLLRQHGKNVQLSKIVLIPGWLLSVYFGIWCYYAPIQMVYRDYQYEAAEMAQYACLSSIAWALFLSWILFVCYTENAGPLGGFLSSYPLVVLSRLCFCLYLSQFLVFFYNVGSNRSSQEFTVLSSVNVAEAGSVLVVSITFALIFDIPAQSLKKIFKSFQFLSKSNDETTEESADNEGDQVENNENNNNIYNENEENDTTERVNDEELDAEIISDELLNDDYIEEDYDDEQYEPQRVLLEDEDDIIIEEEEEELDEDIDATGESPGDGANSYRNELGDWRRRYMSRYSDENEDENELDDWEWTNNDTRARR